MNLRLISIRTRRFPLALGIMALLGWWMVPPPLWGHPDSFAPIVKSQRDKVVHISTRANRGAPPREDDPGSQRPFRFPAPHRGLGSGFIISGDGYIVTNHHVVEGAGEIEVVLADARKFKATLVGADPKTDLALIKIAARNLPAAEFGDSSNMEVGDWVLAIGNPWGLDHTVTAGIISAKGRNIFNDSNLAYGEFLQTDAAINPGNSGGPLFNLEGKVIGVNTAIARRGRGIGFAVPSNLVVAVVRQLRRYGHVRRGWLGVSIQEVDAELSRELKLPRAAKGLIVRQLPRKSPARTAGLRPGDLLTHFGKARLLRVGQLQKLVAFTEPGTRVPLKGLRRESAGKAGKPIGWKPFRVTVRIGRDPRTLDAGASTLLGRMGLRVAEISRRERRRPGLNAKIGVRVLSVRSKGIGHEMGLKAGDIILKAGGADVTSADSLEAALSAAQTAPSKRVSLVVRRGRKILYLVVRRATLNR